MWHTYYAPGTLDETLALLDRHGDACRLIAGGTDLILELERGVRLQGTLIDISRIPNLDRISYDQARGVLGLGPLATHNQVVASEEAVMRAFPLVRACWLVGAPQIRNRGTVAGNMITASPANDTITPLRAMDAIITLASTRGKRRVGIEQFFLGVRRTAIQPDEMLVHIEVPALKRNERGTFLKLGLRQAQAISVVNVAVIVEFADDAPGNTQLARRARIALGAVAPTIIRAAEAEAYLTGRELDEEAIARAAGLAAAAARPIYDIRASAEYRRDMIRVLVTRALRQLRDGAERADWPERPVLLWSTHSAQERHSAAPASPTEPEPNPVTDIHLTLNGLPTRLRGVAGKTLLRALREDAGLTGTKEGCAEGECGACTVWLDGVAVMSCLVPAERAHGCNVVTVEGLAQLDTLHPIQQGFIDAGAVQCGYCTPGFLMSAANLLEEVPHPSPGQVREALTGNLCRCTGYYKILEAVDLAARSVQGG